MAQETKLTKQIKDQQEVFKSEYYKTQFPDGYPPLSDAAVVVYKQYYASRSPNQWSQLDLVALYRLAIQDMKLREMTLQMITEDPVEFTPDGKKIINPFFQAFTRLQASHLAVLRSMSLTLAPAYQLKEIREGSNSVDGGFIHRSAVMKDTFNDGLLAQ